MSRRLDDLSPRFRPYADRLLALCVEAGVPVVIVDTRRTLEEQAAYVAKGVSWTMNSKHLTGDAIDIAPFEVWQQRGPDKINWDANNPQWQILGRLGESLGLRWGGRWRRVVDLGHFELPTIDGEERHV